jgi:hypothetical protein
VSSTLAFESRLLMLEVFEVDVSEVLRRFTLYSTIDRSKTSKRTKTKQSIDQYIINNMMQWLDRFCRYKNFGTKIT